MKYTQDEKSMFEVYPFSKSLINRIRDMYEEYPELTPINVYRKMFRIIKW